MKIEEIYIDGFRSIKNLTIITDGNLQVLIGKNDVGKSNILRALDLFFNNSIDAESFNYDRDFNINYLKAKGKNAPTHITIILKIKLVKDYSSSKLYKDLISKLGEEFYISKKYYSNRITYFYSNAYETLFDMPIEESSELFQQKIAKFLSFVHFYYVPINKDENWLKKSYIFTDIKNRLIDAWGKGGKHQKNVSEFKKNITDTLVKLKKIVDDGMQEISANFKELFPEYSKVTFKTPSNPNDLFELLDIEISSSNNISTTLGLRGSGVQSASIPLLMYYVDRGKILSARNSLYFPIWGIEEPESFQHQYLDTEISKVFIEKISKDIPVFITTHSQSYLMLQNINNIHLIKFEDGTTKLVDTTPEEWQKYLHSISNEIGLSNISIDIIKILKEKVDNHIIVFEGKYDVNVYNKIISISSEIRNKFIKYVTVDGNGGNLPERVKLLSNTKQKIIVILDNDIDGNKYETQINNLGCDHIRVIKYSPIDNAVLETLIPNYVKEEFKKTMPKEALDYWYESKPKIDEIYNTGKIAEPKFWDKNSLKNNLCEFYLKNYSDEKDYEEFITLYNSIQT